MSLQRRELDIPMERTTYDNMKIGKTTTFKAQIMTLISGAQGTHGARANDGAGKVDRNHLLKDPCP